MGRSDKAEPLIENEGFPAGAPAGVPASALASAPASASTSASSSAPAREVLTWERFGEVTRELARDIWDSGYRPDIIVSVARGGLLPAGAIAYALDLKSMLVLNVEFYTGIGVTLKDPRLVEPSGDVRGMAGKKVLIVDDVADSGRTLRFVKELCEEYATEIRVAVLYEKSRSVLKPDYAYLHTDSWIAFPWSDKDPVNGGQAEA
ncbi:phosphoribosyltransferase [Actinotignum sanguinis]|uniref:Phosphoribosyltransferase n=1 Tax=Schaalia turicensis TaxID=131111 RepID=A0ABZ0RCE9_9ACTO|nr:MULTISPECIES: phosphoribosyltransferase [Actinotignum]WPJ89125.1 phosphoribosyltransferase [Schaalia turicensis]MDE1552796.1 phosphoribosyltransferase [Actinotignum sanguinis]MDE1564729.1 phosphoribosyltransferase [Actinotignum sanguinis]MDE1576764.1 phosphoribosyltransferase [Actinotignum sanguinis]MDE1642332.1 phosphoribosyltransferase [Actinotignum sanguinis]